MILSIIIVSYNTKDLTIQTVESAIEDFQNSKLLKNKSEVIVVDNNSKDNSVAALQKLQKKYSGLISIIKNNKNTGFAAANNLGIKKAQGRYLLLLNSDTITQQHALENLVASFTRHPLQDANSVLVSQKGRLDRLGLVAATLLNQDGTLQPQGGSLPTLASLFFHMTMLDDLPLIGRFLPSTQHTGLRQTEKIRYELHNKKPIQRNWVGATALLIRKEVLDEIGLLDEAIFMYGEDVEFCIRAKHHHWDIAIQPQARIIHLGSASSSSAKALTGELLSYKYIWSKHYPHWQMPLLRLILKLGCFLRIILFGTILRDSKKRKAYQTVFQKI